METMLELPPTVTGRKRWSRADCRFLENACVLKGRYELLDGEIILKLGQNRPHALTVSLLLAYLFSLFGPRRVQTQATMEVKEEDRVTNRPEPDIAVLREEVAYVPTGYDVLLAVEISDTTQADDFGRKVSLYARAGVAEYWVIDLSRRVIIAYQQPQGDGWLSRTEYGETDTIASAAAPGAAVAVAELLPPINTSL